MNGPVPGHARDGDSRYSEVVAVISAATTLSTLAVLLRCYSRHVMLRSFGRDDAVMVIAQCLTIASTVAFGFEARYGLGRHVWTVSDDDYIRFSKARATPHLKSLFSSTLVYSLAACLTKVSILLQYRRLFFGSVMRWLIRGGLVLLSAWAVTLAVLPSRCVDAAVVCYVLAVVNLTTDCAVFALPLPVVGALNLPRRQKMLLVGVFSLGVFPCAVSIYRFRALGVVAAAYDPTWDRVDSATWSSLELTVGVVTVCLLTLRPLLAAAFPRVFATVLRRSSTADTVGRGSDRRRAAARAAAAQRVGLVSARTKGWEGSTRELNCSHMTR
ncbi:hypothetical protein B0T24DRAFT_679620 [Lasiosphaeria ovina]|uniref:Rhodopsin domain-containing protein n=1 Tax=Lasiosphaeria ovina TaxID=92902 RepID=A0AAE0N839_9PEZI|nr:hypothetical protein B0T24DRAFT_679620 [Lasiosphaeria ovina]